jgi:hypothetical protein
MGLRNSTAQLFIYSITPFHRHLINDKTDCFAEGIYVRSAADLRRFGLKVQINSNYADKPAPTAVCALA